MAENPFAFAHAASFHEDGPCEADHPPQSGMSLRDYFAAKAMHAELVTAGALPGPARALREAAAEEGQTIVERIAFLSYQMADAMLEARVKGGV